MVTIKGHTFKCGNRPPMYVAVIRDSSGSRFEYGKRLDGSVNADYSKCIVVVETNHPLLISDGVRSLAG